MVLLIIVCTFSQGRMQPTISRMWVIVAVPEQWWMISILARLMQRPFLLRASTTLRSSLNTTRTKLRSSSLSCCNFWYPCWYWVWLLAFASTRNRLEDSLPQNWKRFLQKLARSLRTWIRVLSVDVKTSAVFVILSSSCSLLVISFQKLIGLFLGMLVWKIFCSALALWRSVIFRDLIKIHA